MEQKNGFIFEVLSFYFHCLPFRFRSHIYRYFDENNRNSVVVEKYYLLLLLFFCKDEPTIRLCVFVEICGPSKTKKEIPKPVQRQQMDIIDNRLCIKYPLLKYMNDESIILTKFSNYLIV